MLTCANSIPIIIACIVLFFIHRAHLKRLRREEKNDKDFDMDAGVGEYPMPMDRNEGDQGHEDLEKEDFYRPGTPASVMRELRPPTSTLPYLVPKANVSRESLHSLSDPRDNPYAAIYTSAPPSPGGGGVSTFSDQASISGVSSRHLLTPTEDASYNPAFKPPARVPSPLAISAMPHQSTHPLSIETPEPAPRPIQNEITVSASPVTPKSPIRSSLRERQFQQAETTPRKVPILPTNKAILSREMTDSHEIEEQLHPKVKETVPSVQPQEHTFPGDDGFSTSTEERPISYQPQPKSAELPIMEHQSSLEEQNKDVPTARDRASDDLARPSDYGDYNHDVEHEADEDRAKRIQSVYREYWNDSHYYDGSEEWEQLPRQNHYEPPRQPVPVRPSNYDKHGWRDSTQDYYEGQGWQDQLGHAHQNSGGYSIQYYGDSVGLGINSNYSPPPRPSFYSRHSTSYSASSIPARAQTPQLTEPLTQLPSTRYKLDDLASPIAYSKPKRFIGAAGRDSPVSRSASPVQVLSPSWSTLPELPVPHRLRRSGSFSSINFAPTRKYASSEVDAGDTGSVRSLVRTEASLLAVGAGAGRINRLPQDIVPVGKAGMLASLRPQNYSDVRYG